VSVLGSARRGWEPERISAVKHHRAVSCSVTAADAVQRLNAARDLWQPTPAWLLCPDCGEGLTACQTAPALKGLYFGIRSPKTRGDGGKLSAGAAERELFLWGEGLHQTAAAPSHLPASARATEGRCWGRCWPGPQPRPAVTWLSPPVRGGAGVCRGGEALPHGWGRLFCGCKEPARAGRWGPRCLGISSDAEWGLLIATWSSVSSRGLKPVP